MLEALGTRLREIRTEAGLTGRDLGRLAGWHSSKVSRIEHARQAPSADDITAWCEHSGTEDQAADLIATLRAAEGMFVQWQRMERTGLRVAQESVVPLWERTRRFRIYSSWLIPGPLQTPAYIRALLHAIRVRRGLPDDVEASVRVRVDKQHVIHEGGHRFAVVLEEGTLRYRIGDTDTMAGQLGHLLAMAALPSVSLGIVPLDVDRSALWPLEGFFLYDDEQVNVELVSGHLTVTQPREIAMYADAFAQLADLAVYGAAARTLITAAIRALDN
ncbi:helix-turn-helix transcriptional regulator [Phytohabitans flavus]|uniref:Transcriptional regulator n=1 Tax=Phytohabitans flavus TaxID=1076124 RepID=A0A6F8XY86_9ACTN|nr:transcriptional regulator [Phytohabitans flavus]